MAEKNGVAERLEKLLIANRGEIARRILRTCRALEIATVAVCSRVDRDAPFVREADEVVALEGDSAAETYLDADQLLAAARQTGARAVHPGYGFLAENADFAQAVLDAGLVWVGPPPEAMRRMGAKARARQLAQRAGVPVVPGVAEDGRAREAVLAQARSLGFPVLIKASAGGGGKGMRVVSSAAELGEALQAARREARAAFGDDHLILEKLIDRPRHIEVQVLADRTGRVIHLFERECSIQRRHQKIIEESPAPGLDPALRDRMTQAAVKLARAAGYTNAGTVEFLLDGSGNFYFLEMNARLQVEHPVTEMIIGLDLVEWQLRVAAGEALPFAQEEITPRGHAIEARLYAEAPAQGFAPQTGTVAVWRPAGGAGVRWDSGIEQGIEVSAHYDPLLAKLIAWGADRPAARRRLRAALRDTVLLGVETNLNFLEAVVAHRAFAQGHTHTGFLGEHFGDWREPAPEAPDWLALVAFEAWGTAARTASAPQEAPDPWRLAPGWRNV